MSSQLQSVLVVDDEPGVRAGLVASFRREGWQVESASDGDEARRKFSQGLQPIVVTDIRLPNGDGMGVMRYVHQSAPGTAVILLTAYGSVPEAIIAVQEGAASYLVKPCSFEQLKAAIAKIRVRGSSSATGPVFKGQTDFVGRSKGLRDALGLALAAAQTDADILIEAESGTGKELLARFVHENSARRGNPLVALNCSAVPEALLETELFGHSQGAFTGAVACRAGKFEVASGGTLLLDEIGEMPLQLQPKLLRVLQEREYERVGENRSMALQARIISTTNRPLLSLVEAGLFRADLYFRLNVVPLTLPPLRERLDDIPILAEHFAAIICRQEKRASPDISPEFLAVLQDHFWPGNVRELANLMRRILALHPHGVLQADYLLPELQRNFPPLPNSDRVLTGSSPSSSGWRDVERKLLVSTLQDTGGNRTRTAERLGWSLRTVRNKIREYGLPPRRCS